MISTSSITPRPPGWTLADLCRLDVGTDEKPARVRADHANKKSAVLSLRFYNARKKPQNAMQATQSRKADQTPAQRQKKPFNFGKMLSKKYPSYSVSDTPCLGRQKSDFKILKSLFDLNG